MKMEKTDTRRRAFTLIELLIVVAIIAILAAIAVPNFLDAQTRAKVTRLMADMNSVSQAMEMYHIDNGRYLNLNFPKPEKWDINACFLMMQHRGITIEPDKGPNIQIQDSCGLQLTTPIEYIDAMPVDPFWTMTLMDIWPTIQWSSFAMFLQSGEIREPDNPPMHFKRTDPQIDRENYNGWYMYSVGPDARIWNSDWGGRRDYSSIYDPTNGTISYGDIHWVGGIGMVGGPGNTYAGVDYEKRTRN